VDLADVARDVDQRAIDLLDHLHRGDDVGLGGGELVAGAAGFFLGAHRQCRDQVGDDREAAARLAGAAGLDRGVHRENAGLEGDLVETLDDAVDALGAVGDAVIACTASSAIARPPETVAIAPSARSTVREAAAAPARRRWSIWVTAAEVSSRLAALASVRRARSSEAWAISPEPSRIVAALPSPSRSGCAARHRGVEVGLHGRIVAREVAGDLGGEIAVGELGELRRDGLDHHLLLGFGARAGGRPPACLATAASRKTSTARAMSPSSSPRSVPGTATSFLPAARSPPSSWSGPLIGRAITWSAAGERDRDADQRDARRSPAR
jgi:hypothetical protein